jgi:predicted DNA-binding protein (MmcQ/YjbR family)
MNLESFRAYCLGLPGTDEGTPFGPDTLVLKVAGKMFATLSLDEVPARANLKCDPERAVELREEHDAVLPGYHMNKQHWNTLVLDGRLPASLVRELIDHSYALVVAGLPRRTREALGPQ